MLSGPGDALPPRALHPIFFGSFDWHSAVHGHWLLARLYRRFPDLPEAKAIRALLDAQFTKEKVAGELAYLARPNTGGFERPYGWAWLSDAGRRTRAAYERRGQAVECRRCGRWPTRLSSAS